MKGTLLSTLITHVAIKVKEKLSWIHAFHVKPASQEDCTVVSTKDFSRVTDIGTELN